MILFQLNQIVTFQNSQLFFDHHYLDHLILLNLLHYRIRFLNHQDYLELFHLLHIFFLISLLLYNFLLALLENIIELYPIQNQQIFEHPVLKNIFDIFVQSHENYELQIHNFFKRNPSSVKMSYRPQVWN